MDLGFADIRGKRGFDDVDALVLCVLVKALGLVSEFARTVGNIAELIETREKLYTFVERLAPISQAYARNARRHQEASFE